MVCKWVKWVDGRGVCVFIYRFSKYIFFLSGGGIFRELQMNVLEWKVDANERLLLDLEKKFTDLQTALQNQAAVLTDLNHRVSALERGTLMGISAPLVAKTVPQYAYFPKGYGPPRK